MAEMGGNRVGQPEFDITIGKDGKLRVEVKGSAGKQCLELADLIRDIVGKEDSRELTTEYYGEQSVRMDVKVRNKRTS